jgi:hypothetical protein
LFVLSKGAVGGGLGLAKTQTYLHEAMLACALERYRLANDHFPETLELLSPQYVAKLPHDIITGQPLKYKLNADGQFILYSVGPNERDDGGQYRSDYDWVWYGSRRY